MRDIHLRRSEILDPPGKKYWPIYTGRDGCRAPMQWDGSPFAGFSTAKPWLPVHPDHLQRNVAAQRSDPGSLFNFTKRLLALRKEFPALRQGDFIPLETPGGTLAYLRQMEGQSMLVRMNFTKNNKNFTLPEGEWSLLLSNGKGSAAALVPFEIQVLVLK